MESKVDPESLRFAVSLNFMLSYDFHNSDYVPALSIQSDKVAFPPSVVVGLYIPLLPKSVDFNTYGTFFFGLISNFYSFNSA